MVRPMHYLPDGMRLSGRLRRRSRVRDSTFNVSAEAKKPRRDCQPRHAALEDGREYCGWLLGTGVSP